MPLPSRKQGILKGGKGRTFSIPANCDVVQGVLKLIWSPYSRRIFKRVHLAIAQSGRHEKAEPGGTGNCSVQDRCN